MTSNSAIKISEFETLYNVSEVTYPQLIFNFPNNPYVIAPQTSTKKQLISIPFRSISTGMDFDAVAPTQIVLTGTMFGTDRTTNMSKLAHWCYSAGIKRLYFTSTKFIYVWGVSLPQTFNSNRSQFIDYQIVFQSPFPYFITAGTNGAYSVLGPIAVTGGAPGASTTVGAIANTSGTAPLYAMKFEIAYSSGDKITKVELTTDGSYTLGTNKCLVWEDATGIAAGETLQIWLFKSVNNIIKIYWCCKSSTPTVEFGGRQVSATVIDGLKAEAYTASTTISCRLTGGNANVSASYFTGASYSL